MVVGPFANLSDDFMVLCDFLGRARALNTISCWNISPKKHALAINRHILVSRFGHLASLMWARLILGRFRDAVLPDPHSPSSSGAFFNVFSSDPRRGLRLFAVFGFSFLGPPKEPYSNFISFLASTNIPVISVDVPSGWDVDQGDIYDTKFKPSAVVSLTLPKLCMKDYKGFHFVGGRFIPPNVADKF